MFHQISNGLYATDYLPPSIRAAEGYNEVHTKTNFIFAAFLRLIPKEKVAAVKSDTEALGVT